MPRKSRTTNEETPSFREKIADTVGISKEVLLDTVAISCMGNRELTLENYKSILAYSDTLIRIKANPHPVQITGKHLELKTITRELLYITGAIEQIGFGD